MENPVGEVMDLVYKLKLKRPNYLFRKNQGQWQCTCIMVLDSKTLEEIALGQTKREAKAQSSRQILSILKPYFEKVEDK